MKIARLHLQGVDPKADRISVKVVSNHISENMEMRPVVYVRDGNKSENTQPHAKNTVTLSVGFSDE